jgi:Ca-activated chloride channel family protein
MSPMRPSRRALVRWSAALAVAAVLAGCTGGGRPSAPGTPGSPGQQPSAGGGPAATLRVLAGSELKDVEPLLPEIRKATGVSLKLDYIGTLDGAERIAGGRGTDLAWFSSARYLTLLTQERGKGRPVASERIMLSPVVLGVKRSVARRFGWAGNPDVTWKDIAAKAKAGQLHYGMTNPAASNSGFSALVGVAAAFAGTGDALQARDIDAARLTDFFSGQTLTAGSSGFLADAYVNSQDRLDGLINYESVLLSLNASGRLHDPLELVYPRDGIITADYPLLLLNPDKRAQYDRVVAYLRSPAAQRRLMATTARRPALPDVPLDGRFPKRVLVELPFPASLSVVNDLVLAYLNRLRRPAHAIFVLDLSGSMQGARIAALKQALQNLTGADTSVTGQFARFRERERITMITFSDQVLDERDFAVEPGDGGAASLAAIRAYVDGLQTGGATAIFSATMRAYQRAADDARTLDRGAFTSVVLMTDGENNRGISSGDFLGWLAGMPDQTRAVKTFAIRFGEASPAELRRIASGTGGAMFDATQESLAQAFKEIRGYQ